LKAKPLPLIFQLDASQKECYFLQRISGRDFVETNNYHFVGIGGIGMSALARILMQRNARVSGSDLAPSAVTEALRSAGAQLFYGHSPEHVKRYTTVVYTSDVNAEHPEVLAARKLQCPLLHRSELLAALMQGHRALAITGTHGKTTTTSLLTWVLRCAGLDPSYAIGGLLAQQQGNAGHGTGDIFVAEADESDGSFLRYMPEGAILTNIDLDHLSHYGSEEALIAAFATFAAQVKSPRLLFWCGDDRRLQQQHLPGTAYGFGAHCPLRVTGYAQKGWHVVMDVEWEGNAYRGVDVALTGRHNALNALAVFGMALRLGVDESRIREALRTFPGVGRRCERKGEHHTILVIDDYAHHPTEVQTTLAAIRQAVAPRRLIAIYQPHRYTRTLECVGTYGAMFDSADEVLITDIYGAREVPIPDVTHEVILREVLAQSSVPCRYVPRHQLLAQLQTLARPYDVVVTLGAGDITALSLDLSEHWRRQAPQKLTVGFICGGISTEHNVSLLSAQQVLPRLNRSLYDVLPFGITKQGHWISEGDVIARLEALSKEPQSPQKAPTRISEAILQQLADCDVLIPLLHGTYGEDGIAQGFFDVLGKAYVGCDHRASAISMDKAVAKKLCQIHGIHTAPFIDFSRDQWEHERSRLLEEIEDRLEWPVWVKPTHLGSSIEVHRVESREALYSALTRIFRVDTHAIAEPEVRGRELEVAILGNDQLTVFPPGEVFTAQCTYDYAGKYSSGGTPTAAIADIPPAVAQEGMELSRRIYRLAGCTGLARIDYFLDTHQRYWFNEINPLPGFTRNSLYPRMCEANGLPLETLFDTLILLACQRRRAQDRLKV
jgi:UDP-N-acetylmuramate--alanine ligase